ncbi:MAG: TIR domain-containing protein [Planctomycetia bacterium]|nr:TIR domain-containing protein [Planctomycetia bacterium]
MAIPKVFISYSHDSKEHKLWVLELATRMRQEGGIDTKIDQWGLKPGDDLAHFMETNLVSSDYTVMVCTERYVEKANAGVGGVGYEKMIITSDLLKRVDSNKVIPIIRQRGKHVVPTFIQTKFYIDFSIDEENEFKFDELIRTIQNAPIYKEPEIGKNPFPSKKESRPDKTGDALHAIMKEVVSDFEDGKNWTLYKDILNRLDISRVMLDILIKKAVNLGYIRLDSSGDLVIENGGKHYAINQGLVKKL